MFKGFKPMNYSINMNSLIIRIISNFLVFLGIVSPGLVFLPLESMRGIFFSCLILVHVMFFLKRLLNQKHNEFLVLFILIFGFLLIESRQVLYEGNFGLFRFIIMICFGLIFSYCTSRRSDYFLPALSTTCLFLFTSWILSFYFNTEIYFKPDGTPASVLGSYRFLPVPRPVLFSSPKEISILFVVMFIYFSFLYNLKTSALPEIKIIIKRSSLLILTLMSFFLAFVSMSKAVYSMVFGLVVFYFFCLSILEITVPNKILKNMTHIYFLFLITISFFMLIIGQTASTYAFFIFHLIFIAQSNMNNKPRIIFNCSLFFLIAIGIFFFVNDDVKISENYIGSLNVIKNRLFTGIAQQISSAIIIGPGIGYFDTHAYLGAPLRFVENIEDSSLVLRLIFEVGLIPVLAFALFIIYRFKEGFKYLLYVAVASLPLGHYHTSYILGILVGSLIINKKFKCNDVML